MRRDAMPDDTFLQCCLDEVRDGEDVTIATVAARVAVLNALRKLGATEEELECIEVTWP